MVGAWCCCPCLGMYTRLTGSALNGSAFWCTLSASFALASGVSTTSPSTPAVMRPALRSVTRRTLKSVFARDRSINFCRLRTFFRSPAFDAVKIRCRNRRTSSSTRRQSTGVPVKGRVLWSVHHDRASWRPTCPRVPGLRSSFSSQAHLTASAPFRAGPPGPVSVAPMSRGGRYLRAFEQYLLSLAEHSREVWVRLVGRGGSSGRLADRSELLVSGSSTTLLRGGQGVTCHTSNRGRGHQSRRLCEHDIGDSASL